TVAILAPGAYVGGAADDPFTVSASTPDGDVTGVELFRCSDASADCAGGAWVSLGTDASAPYEASWDVGDDGNVALRAVATDRAGTVKVDLSAPSVGVALSESSPWAVVDGDTVTINPAHAGAFTVTASPADAESGIDSVAFPVIFGGDGATRTGAPWVQSYAW